MSSTLHTKRTYRRGTTLLEVTVSLLILSSVAVAFAQLLTLVSLQRRTAQRRQLATGEAANVMEQIAALSWSDLTKANVAKLKLSQAVASKLPAGKLKVDLAPLPQQPEAVRVVVEIGWQNRAGQSVQPLRLSAWRYRDAAPNLVAQPSNEGTTP